MLKAVFLLQRRPDMDVDRFRTYWREVHGPLVARIPGLRRYVQRHVLPSGAGGAPLADGLAELEFDSVAGMQSALASPEGQTVMADLANFLDGSRSGMLIVEDHQVVYRARGERPRSGRYTLNLKSITSPSATTYSLPSIR